MIKLINAVTGGDMWVHESRVEEYLAAGHKLAPPPPVKEAPKTPVKRPTKKTAAKIDKE